MLCMNMVINCSRAGVSVGWNILRRRNSNCFEPFTSGFLILTVCHSVLHRIFIPCGVTRLAANTTSFRIGFKKRPAFSGDTKEVEVFEDEASFEQDMDSRSLCGKKTAEAETKEKNYTMKWRKQRR